MVKFVKIILFLLLAITLHGIASNDFTYKVEHAEHIADLSVPQEQVNVPQFPYLPVAELINYQAHQISMMRFQRVQLCEYFLSLRSILQECISRENLLSHLWAHIYNTTTAYYCQPSSEYYVFTLRRIII